MTTMPETNLPSPDENRSITMTRRSLANLPPRRVLPANITLRTMTGLDEAAVWTAVQRDAEPFLTIGDDLFVQQFGGDPTEIPVRCLLAVDTETGDTVGASSAWHGGDPGARGRDWGRIHWVAVRPAYQRRGIARALVVECLYVMQALGHEHAYLSTSTGRQGAIVLYEDLGFTVDTVG